MHKAHVIVGPFQRPVFRQGLMKKVAELEFLAVRSGDESDVQAHLDESELPLVYIADSHFGVPEIAEIQEGNSLTLCLIEDEGREVGVSLKDVDMRRLAGLIAAAVNRPLMRIAPSREHRGNLLTKAIQRLVDRSAGGRATWGYVA